MQATLDLNEDLVKRAAQSTGDPDLKSLVEKALHLLIETRSQGAMRQLFGQISWEGDLDEMRTTRSFDDPQP